MTERIQLILKTYNLSPSQFADEIQVQRSGLSHILSGRNKPSLDFVTKILDHYPDISPEWLLFGKGQMLKKLRSESSPEKNDAGKPFEKQTVTNKKPEEEKQPEEIVIRKDIRREKEETKQEAEIEKIVIFYKNNTFSEFLPK
jgi:transcriptional regulator with XRE-family HTH domain